MMTELLVQWVLTGAFLILAVLALRGALGRKISAGLRYALWAAVLVRLFVPGQLFTSPVAGMVMFQQVEAEESLPNAEPLPELPDRPRMESGQTGQGQAVFGGFPAAPAMPDPPTPPEVPAPPDLSRLPAVLGWVWLAGSAVLALVLLLCNLRFVRHLRRRRTVLAGTDCPLPVYVAPNLSYSCLCGLLHPAVYVTPDTADDPVMLRHVLAHELTHFRHLDHIWNVLRCAALIVHWWDPLVWLAARLSSRDGELACDEGALRLLGDGERAAYGRTLLALSADKSAAGLWNCATAMAGDSRSLRERVLRIAHAPRRAVWAAVLAVTLLALASACAFGQAEQPDSPDPAPTESVTPGPLVDDTGTVPVHAVHPEQRLRDIPFYSVDEGRTLTLGTMGEVVDPYGEGFEVTRYTLVDLDGDGVQELILWSEVERTGGVYLILHEIDGTLYGYGCAYKEMANIKADGTFYDGYVAVGEGMGVGYATMSFTGTGCESTPFTYSLTLPSLEDGSDGNYLNVVNGQPADGWAFSDAQEEQELKYNVAWRMNAEILPYAPDLNRNGVPEIVVLSDLCCQDREDSWYPDSVIEVWENGSLLWQGLASDIHAGQTSFLLYSQDGESCLMEFDIHGGFGQAHGDYRIFTLENGTETAVREGHVKFDYCSDAIASVKDNFDPEAVAAFVDEVDGLLADCALLVDTGANYREDALRVDLSWLESYAPGFQWNDGRSTLENLQTFREIHLANK